MKKNYILITIVFACFACKRDNIDENKLNITVCNIHNPEWLLTEIDKMQKLTEPTFRSIQVYLIKYDEQEYLLISDLMSSSICDGKHCYTCSGESIACSSSLYNALIALYLEGNYVLVWSNL